MEKDIPNVVTQVPQPGSAPGLKKTVVSKEPLKSKKCKSADAATCVKLTVSAPGLKNTVVPKGPLEDQKYKSRFVLKDNHVHIETSGESILEATDAGSTTAGSSTDHVPMLRQEYMDPGIQKRLTLNCHALHKAYQEAYIKTQSEQKQSAFHEIRMQVPPCLGQTVAAERICSRVMLKDWVVITTAEIPEEWRAPVGDSYLLAVQNIMGIKKGSEGEFRRLCVVCATDTDQRCLCLTHHFCSMQCLKHAWPAHKNECRTGTKPKMQASAVVTLPEYSVCIAYQKWLNTQSSEDCVGIIVEDRNDWVKTYGSEAMYRTCLSLALKGKPSPIFTRIMFRNEGSLDFVQPHMNVSCTRNPSQGGAVQGPQKTQTDILRSIATLSIQKKNKRNRQQSEQA